jgi:hypothetical protein
LSKQLDLEFENPITITDYEDTFTISTPIDMCDSEYYSYSTGDNITVTTTNGSFDPLGFSYKDININTDNLFEDLPVKIGKYELTEKTIEKVLAVLDIFENDEDLKDVLKSQMALNRIKNENKSN